MPQTMTNEKEGAIIAKAHEFLAAGNKDEWFRIVREELPMPPYLAEFAKSHLGADFLIKGKFNLTEAEAEFGPGWLAR